jgi:hypothetical protein
MPNLQLQRHMKNALQMCFVPDTTMETEHIVSVMDF